MSEWDSRLPASVADVISLLERRVVIHESWRDRLLKKDKKALKAAVYGVGDVASHETYVNQYRAAIEVLLSAPEDAST